MADPEFEALETDAGLVEPAAEPGDLPTSLLGCFQSDPVSRVNGLDDWGYLELMLPRDVFAIASGGSSGAGPKPPPSMTASVSLSAALDASLDRRLDSIRREPAVKRPRSGSGLPA